MRRRRQEIKNRDEVDAKALFEASGGRDIIIIDSNENLPDKLKEYINKPDKPSTERIWSRVTERLIEYDNESEEHEEASKRKIHETNELYFECDNDDVNT